MSGELHPIDFIAGAPSSTCRFHDGEERALLPNGAWQSWREKCTGICSELSKQMATGTKSIMTIGTSLGALSSEGA